MKRMLSQLEGNDTEVTTESAFQELFQRPEITLIESAAIALGRAGVMGYENQGALNFYMVARALIKARGREEMEGDMLQDQAVESHRQRRSEILNFFLAHAAAWAASIPLSHAISLLYFPDECDNNGHTCRRCPIGENCQGMCGPGCDCWDWVCGGCCYHRGCYDHDRCCERGRLLCWVPIGFNCLFFICP